MSAWRREAIAQLPELKKTIESADNVMSLWTELWYPFCRAYEQDPRDESLIRRVYAYAHWCMAAPRGPNAATDPASAVAVAFLEHLPTNPLTRADMPRWFTADQMRQSREVFSYLLKGDEFDELMKLMSGKKIGSRR